MNKVGVVILICVLVLVGCNQKEVVETVEEDTGIKIGLSFDSFVIERWHREQDAFVSKAEELGAKVYVQNANGDVNKQINQLEYFIKEGVDVIVVVPTDGDAICPVIKKAKSEGIKVIAYDRLIKNANVDLYMSFDNELIGKLLTKGLLEGIPNNGKILVIMGSSTDNNVSLIDAEFKRLVSQKNVKILDKVYAENWQAEVAFNVVSEHLNKGEQMDGIFCGNDDLAQQAIMALSEHRKAGEVCVVGQDADLPACQRIVEGTQNMTIFKNVMTLARDAAVLAVKLAQKQDLEVEERLNDGTYEVPYYKLMPAKVTKENMDQVIIESGFHLREEVYLNLVEKEK